MIKLTPSQEKVLMEISEKVLLKKMGLSEKFPRKMLHTRKSALGVGLIKPSTMVLILSLKLHVGHVRAQNRIARII